MLAFVTEKKGDGRQILTGIKPFYTHYLEVKNQWKKSNKKNKKNQPQYYIVSHLLELKFGVASRTNGILPLLFGRKNWSHYVEHTCGLCNRRELHVPYTVDPGKMTGGSLLLSTTNGKSTV